MSPFSAQTRPEALSQAKAHAAFVYAGPKPIGSVKKGCWEVQLAILLFTQVDRCRCHARAVNVLVPVLPESLPAIAEDV